MSDLGYLMERRREAGGSGAGMSELGFMLGGGGAARRQQIFNQAASQSALMQDRLAQARQRQQDEIEKDYQRSQRRSAQTEIDKNDHLGALLYGGGEKYGEVTEGQLKAQKTRFQQEAWAHRYEDANKLNRDLMVIDGKPVEFQRSLGDGSYTENAYDTTSKPKLSDIGRAFVAEKGALAAEHGAQAERARAGVSADKASNYAIEDTPQGKVRINKLTGETSPLTLNGEAIARPARAFTEAELKAAIGDTEGQGVDPDKFRRCEAVRAKTNSDNDALQQMDEMNSNAVAMGPPAPPKEPEPGYLDSVKAGLSSLFSPKAAATPKAGTPQVGDVRRGYVFKGGDPSDKANWVKQ